MVENVTTDKLIHMEREISQERLDFANDRNEIAGAISGQQADDPLRCAGKMNQVINDDRHDVIRLAQTADFFDSTVNRLKFV